MHATNAPIDLTVDPFHVQALMRAVEDENEDAVAAITLMLEQGAIPYEWVQEYGVNQYYFPGLSEGEILETMRAAVDAAAEDDVRF